MSKAVSSSPVNAIMTAPVMECGGKRSATPLFLLPARFRARSKAVSPLRFATALHRGFRNGQTFGRFTALFYPILNGIALELIFKAGGFARAKLKSSCKPESQKRKSPFPFRPRTESVHVKTRLAR